MSLGLAPLANVVAVLHREEGALLEYERRIRALTSRVIRPAPGWVVGIEPLVGSVPDPPRILDKGIVFLEGREHVLSEDPSGGEIDRVRDMLDHPNRDIAPLPYDVGVLVFTDHSATLVRSVSGRVPLYVGRPDPSTTVVSTLLGRQVELTGVGTVDPLPLALASTGGVVFPDGRTPLKTVRSVSPASVADVTLETTRQRSYWSPPPPASTPSEADLLDRQRRFRSALTGILDRELDSRRSTILALSGGVDSAALAVLAAKRHRPLTAYTIELERNTPEAAHNARFIEAALDEGGIGSHTIEYLDDDATFEWLSKSPVSAIPANEPTLMRLNALKNDDTVGFMGGWVADEAAGSLYGFDAWARAKSWRELPTLRVPGAIRKVGVARRKARHVIRRSERVNLRVVRPDWLAEDVRSELDEWYERASRPEWAGHPRSELLVAHLVHGLEGHWEVASDLGIRTVLPFAYKPVLDISYECHPNELLGSSTKQLLRGALAADVSHLLLGREDKGRWATAFEHRRPPPARLPAELRGMIRDEVFDPAQPGSPFLAIDLATAAKCIADIEVLKSTTLPRRAVPRWSDHG